MAGAEFLLAGTRDGLVIWRAATGGVLSLERHALAGVPVSAVVAADPLTLLVAAEGLPPRQSFDGGATWIEAHGPPPEPVGLRAATLHGPAPLAYPRLSGATAYARLGGRQGPLVGAGAGGMQLFVSEDDGIHWAPARMTGSDLGRVTALAPSSLGRRSGWAGTDGGALLRTTDGGRSWREVARAEAAILCLAGVAAG
jgi:hypothetical protein